MRRGCKFLLCQKEGCGRLRGTKAIGGGETDPKRVISSRFIYNSEIFKRWNMKVETFRDKFFIFKFEIKITFASC